MLVCQWECTIISLCVTHQITTLTQRYITTKQIKTHSPTWDFEEFTFASLVVQGCIANDIRIATKNTITTSNVD